MSGGIVVAVVVLQPFSVASGADVALWLCASSQYRRDMSHDDAPTCAFGGAVKDLDDQRECVNRLIVMQPLSGADTPLGEYDFA